jgi:signal transduction histidine kinase
MNRNIEKLQALVDDVMDVYKLDMGKLRFSMTDTDITKLINDTISELRPLTLAKKIDLNADIKANGTVFCDPNRIQKTLTNYQITYLKYNIEQEILCLVIRLCTVSKWPKQ